jgi:UDP-N-acetylmuramyl pentapeptide synthase
MGLNIALAAWELQVGLKARLAADAPHMALIGSRLYDHVPQTTADGDFPFEDFATTQEGWGDTFDTGFRDVTIQLDVWSRYHGRKEAAAILASQVALINRQQAQIALATLTLVSIRLDYSDVLQDPDGLTWHGVARYVAHIQASN